MTGEAARAALLAWFEGRRSRYPWRGVRDPYRVVVSEVMLQQTQAPRVVPHYERFVARYPDVRTLALAPRADVIRAWDGLGYNRRAVALSEAARTVVRDHAGEFPRDVETLGTLPGVGPYTAAAVASIAFGARVPAIDTNVRRVVARVLAGAEAATLRRGDLERLAAAWLDPRSPGDHNEALMDLGREYCRPRARCEACPLASACRSASRVPSPSRGRTKVEPFEGSSRQVRGAVVRALREAPRSLAALAATTGFELERVHEAVLSLARDGVVSAGPSAIRALPRGVVRLAG